MTPGRRAEPRASKCWTARCLATNYLPSASRTGPQSHLSSAGATRMFVTPASRIAFAARITRSKGTSVRTRKSTSVVRAALDRLRERFCQFGR